MPAEAAFSKPDFADKSLQPAPDEFGSKPIWQRMLIIFAGPLMSFVLAYAIFCLIGVTTGWPSGRLLTRIAEVEPGGEGQRIGLYTGDEIVAINGTRLADGRQMVSLIRHDVNQPITLTIRHDGSIRTAVATPRPLMLATGKPEWDVDVISPGSLANAFGLQSGDVLEMIDDAQITTRSQAVKLLTADAGRQVTLTIARGLEEKDPEGTVPEDYKTRPTTFAPQHEAGVLQIEPDNELKRTSLMQSIREGNAAIAVIYEMLRDRLRQHDLQKTTGGIIMMYQATDSAVKDQVETGFRCLSLVAELSLSLAIFNLLPIPILDGGHLLALFIEWVRRGKKMTEQQQQAFMMTGLAIIAALMVFIYANDILKNIHHQMPQ
jgi:regulator of sigma E protease